ncbi:transcriptional regulator, MarR family [Gordonia polyisoprenivorans VH2]|uniref:Transcriptional regulator, MarR family n=2 Tax=Gordonia polyisoprenivorans TaxID=84595 RepID=H6MSF5_GORPV|nr:MULTISPECIES: MarR family winged helix-turn-helix transcriptional regulator [Gordonia]AFA72532.1 transcriptional regulator, MarR family [Gordonia polyisoprenivorans VH2]MBE7191390.1 winged helix-turn-helix transcriptional regulator [Gordonia polyisoprenivorans]MDF3283158.1 MarR family winged helix-turn-helix transcriptional regulator [Gordonia sp. N1V]NKY01377.1 winged helix-turn-helix transcriptional regulator [Gordonia polyisoprenivorans]OPX14364.1 MarR family transcriptional regulator [G
MTDDDILDVAAGLRLTLGVLLRRLRAHRNPDDPSVPETTVLARLDRDGESTAAELARREQITPQSMGVTISSLLSGGLVAKAPDPADGRRAVLRLTAKGRAVLGDRRNHRTQAIATAMTSVLDADEIRVVAAALPLLDRVAEAL